MNISEMAMQCHEDNIEFKNITRQRVHILKKRIHILMLRITKNSAEKKEYIEKLQEIILLQDLITTL